MVELVANYSKLVREARAVERALAVREQRDVSAPHPSEPTIHRANERLGATEVSRLVARYESGESAEALGREAGIAKQTVIRLVKNAGVPLHRPRLTETQVNRAIGLYEEGWSLVRVATELACDPATVRNVLIQADVPRRDSHGRARG